MRQLSLIDPLRSYVHGLASLFQQGDTGFRRTRYTAVVEPTLKRFDLRSNWRIFQAQTVPDIITSMLAEQKLTDIRSEICFEHQPREYCVQAGETDLDFIARLAAEEGLLYTFEHRADGHTLVLTDRVGGLGTIGTLRIDTEATTLSLTHRISLPNHLGIRVLEARFETDPSAPLIKRAAKEML